jgi:predicted metal-dependent HD superfamily phosphohydrolase
MVAPRRDALHSVAVDLATIFHDIIYDAVGGGGGRNERESARVFVEFAENTTMPADRINKVVQWIERTWTHDGADLDDDGRLFMDFDMSILGADHKAYALYASQVRLEYGHVNWLYWRIGRSQFLSSSTSKRVFCTSEFAGLEGKALENARAECLKLRLELFVAACAGVAGLGVAGRVMLSLL